MELICGDCLVEMQNIPDKSIDLIVTDPPYRLTSRGSSGTMSGYWASSLSKQGKVFENNDIDIEEYLPQFYRVLKDGTHCYIMTNQSNLPHFLDVISKSFLQSEVISTIAEPPSANGWFRNLFFSIEHFPSPYKK